jgi:hypothetical protein
MPPCCPCQMRRYAKAPALAMTQKRTCSAAPAMRHWQTAPQSISLCDDARRFLQISLRLHIRPEHPHSTFSQHDVTGLPCRLFFDVWNKEIADGYTAPLACAWVFRRHGSLYFGCNGASACLKAPGAWTGAGRSAPATVLRGCKAIAPRLRCTKTRIFPHGPAPPACHIHHPQAATTQRYFRLHPYADMDIACATERCRSGRTGRSRKPLSLYGDPGFESLSLRQSSLILFNKFFLSVECPT